MATEIHGLCDLKFEELGEVFQNNFDQGHECGASLAVTVDGELVVDLWGGHADPKKTRPWQEDTVVLVFSSTKFAVSLCSHLLIERGLLDIDKPVYYYWPEFAAGGKDKALVRHLYTHSAGVPGFDPPIPFATRYDWEAITAAIANQVAWWEPGTQGGYHGGTYGEIMGELVRRITGQTIGQFFENEITTKVGADFQIGFDMTQRSRLASTIPIPPEEVEQATPGTMPWKVQRSSLPPAWEDPQCLTSEMPSMNGITGARGLAQIAAIYAMNGELNGHRFLSPATIDRVLTEHSYYDDVLFGMPFRLGLGVGLNSREFDCPSDGSLHWGGAGGSFVIADRNHRVSIGYAMNRMLPGKVDDPRNQPLRRAFNRIVTGGRGR